MVGVPLAWEEQEHIARLQSDFRTVGSTEYALALWVVEQLVFVERTALLHIEVVAVGMAFGGIVLARGYLLVAHGADGESPERIALVSQEVFTLLHFGMSLLGYVVMMGCRYDGMSPGEEGSCSQGIQSQKVEPWPSPSEVTPISPSQRSAMD